MTQLEGKITLITGCAAGIGRLMAQRAAASGSHVVLWDINEQGMEALRDQLARWGFDASCYAVDLSRRDSIARAAERTLGDLGGVDVLINNAGIVSGKPLLELTDDQIIRTYDVNTLSLYWTTRAFLPGMLARKNGHIVTIASAGGIVAAPRQTDYAASKFAAVGFDEALRVELKRDGHAFIRTTVVCPYYIDTGMFEGVKTRFPWLLPILQPDDVADKVIAAVQKNRERVLLPPSVLAAFPGRLLPVSLFDKLTHFLGISSTMDEFTGHDGR